MVRLSYGSRVSACLRKRKYTKDEAMVIGAKHGNTTYYCLFCSCWHLTKGKSKVKNKRQMKRQRTENDPIKNFKRYGVMGDE